MRHVLLTAGLIVCPALTSAQQRSAPAALTLADAIAIAREHNPAYRQALNNALDARERAQNAAKETVNKKATARADADKAIAEAAAALADAHGKIKSAEAGRAAPKTTAAASRAVGQDETRLQDARTAFDRGDYLAAIDKAHAAAADLRAAVHDLEAAPVPAGRRRR